VRAKRSFENDAEYWAHVQANGLKKIAQTEMTVDDAGQFTFEGIPAEQVFRLARNRLAFFTIAVEAAETEEDVLDDAGNTLPDQKNLLMFAPAQLHNVQVGEDDATLLLEPFDAIGVKEQLIARLSALAPLNYQPEEAAALAWVNQVKSGDIMITPEIDEALWRSI